MSEGARHLRKMIEEVRRTEVPALDWDQVEQKIFDRLECEDLPQPVPQSSWPRLVAVVAVAAALALSVTSVIQQPSPMSARDAPHVTHSVLASSLADEAGPIPMRRRDLGQGAIVEADTDSITFDHDGWAQWTATRGSRVGFEEVGSKVVLRLEAGTVHARVGSGLVDSFVVLVGGTRVSVHGTEFSVERRSDQVLVSVKHGSVAVGPAARVGGTPGWLVVGPSRGLFSLDGARSASFLPPSSYVAAADPLENGNPNHNAPPSTGQSEEPDTPPPDSPKLPLPVRGESLPETLTPTLANAPLQQLTRGIEHCYRKFAGASPSGVTVRVHTVVALTVAPDGHVALGRFEPPLTPDAQRCASGVVSGAKFPKARTESSFRVPLEF